MTFSANTPGMIQAPMSMPTTVVEIRPLARDELAWALRLDRVAFGGDRWKPRQLLEFLELGHDALVLLCNYAKAGTIWYEANGDEVLIVNVAVEESFRGRGYGRLLIEHVLHGYERARLQVRVDNNTAIRLYERLGFRVERFEKKYYADGTAAYHMTWRRDG